MRPKAHVVLAVERSPVTQPEAKAGRSSRHTSHGRWSICCHTNQAAGQTRRRERSGQSLCILGVGVDTRRVPVPKSASTATVPLTETMRPKPWRSWQTRSPTQKTSSGGIASRAALKGLAGRRRRCTGGGMYPSSSLKGVPLTRTPVYWPFSATRSQRDMIVSHPTAPRSPR
jgi:hypothetical protein